MAQRWSGDPRYAHGYLVPVFSLALLWMRREQIVGQRLQPRNWGIALIALGAGVQILGGYFRMAPFEGLALLFYLGGIAVMLGGWRALRWALPSIMFLFFMIPLPFRVELALGPPLQWIATQASTFALQTLGFMAFAEGNQIQINDGRIGVAEACSGLSMLITFIALSTGMAIVVKRPLVDRIVLVLSAIPVALISNIARITLTGALQELASRDVADHFYHDLAGWVMIPLALGLYWCEIWVLSHVLVEMEERSPVLLGAAVGRSPATRSGESLTSFPQATRRG
jgi:exosortase